MRVPDSSNRSGKAHDKWRSENIGSRHVIDVERFKREGYLVIPNVFSDEEIILGRQKISAIVRKQVKENEIIVPPGMIGLQVLRGELLNIDSLRPLVLDTRIVDTARTLLGSNVLYYGDSSVHFGNKLNRTGKDVGWHRDCPGPAADPEKIVWQNDYPILRFGIYFQDHANHSGGLGVIPRSHLDQRVKGPQCPVLSRLGDLVVWNQRIIHVGHLPQKSREPDGLRIGMFVSLARASPQLTHYVNWMGSGNGWMGDRVIQDRWKSTILDSKVRTLLAAVDVSIYKPIAKYGEFPKDN
jgi:hypothetical protein